MEALRNSVQSVAEGRLGFSKAISLTGELAGLRLVLEEGVRGPMYRLLQKEAQGEEGHSCTNTKTCWLAGEKEQILDLVQIKVGERQVSWSHLSHTVKAHRFPKESLSCSLPPYIAMIPSTVKLHFTLSEAGAKSW